MKSFGTVTVVGVGLVGGSIGCALLKRGLAERVIGVGRRQETLRTARRVGAVTNTTVDLAKGVQEAELVVVCTPVGRIVEDVRRAAESCPEGTLLTDVGSTKGAIVEALDTGLAQSCRFLGSHPMAGGERTGPAHASGDLFEGRVTVLTPTRNTRASDFDRLEGLWTALGSVVLQMSPQEHDRLVGLASHLPHAVAVALAASVPEECLRVAGAGLADTTRVAAGASEIWMPVFQTNRDNLLAALDLFRHNLDSLRGALASGDDAQLERILIAAKKKRDALGS